MRHPSLRRLAAALVATAATAGGAQAAVVADSLPYQGSPDWSTVVFSGTSMSTDGTSSTLTTRQVRGVWFGYNPGAPPAWSLGTAAQGNYLSLDLSFSANAADWSLYLYDQTHFLNIAFAPTNCVPGNCYGATPQAGVTLHFADGADADTELESQFVALDLTQSHTFEALLKNGQVSYRIDGHAYTGAAHAVSNSQLLVIGDGSGSTLTGVGSMYVHGASLDTAPAFDVLETTAVGAVPEPGTWALMIGGFGVAGAALRRRRALAAVA